jgi:hypothetical protein
VSVSLLLRSHYCSAEVSCVMIFGTNTNDGIHLRSSLKYLWWWSCCWMKVQYGWPIPYSIVLLFNFQFDYFSRRHLVIVWYGMHEGDHVGGWWSPSSSRQPTKMNAKMNTKISGFVIPVPPPRSFICSKYQFI